ncbi:MAG: hypothetical protein CMJ31_00285 [Phycisphaerae bacterium]|nr:hypothetical protein [Phycisphaerae bacterium]
MIRLSKQTDSAALPAPEADVRVVRRLHAINVFAVCAISSLLLVVVISSFGTGSHWEEYERTTARKLAATEALATSIGYGGMIHHLKNFVLRGDEHYARKCDTAFADAREAIAAYESIPDISLDERHSLLQLATLIDAYERALGRVRGASLHADQADILARVDDTAFVAAHTRLRDTVQTELATATDRFRRRNETATATAIFVAIASSTTILVFGSMIIGSVRRRLSHHAERREEALKRAEAASEYKSLFLANMSHEIRTPMTAIIGFADMLVEEDLIRSEPPRAVDAAATIRLHAGNLLTIINDILDVSKIEAGKLELEFVDTDPVNIIEQTLSLVGPIARSKGVALRVDYKSPIPELIKSDPTRLRQIIVNLVGNAIKFTEEGDVTIAVTCDPNARSITFSVIDTGIGMTPQQLESITRFEAFTQADRSTSRRFGGTGLGLRLSHEFATRLGGDIDANSTYGVGSEFTVTVNTGDLDGIALTTPASTSELRGLIEVPARSPVPEPSDAHPLENTSILLVEDSPDNQRLIRHYLEKAGAEVTICVNGAAAVDYLSRTPEEQQPDVVLMDMQMPIMDGYDATRRLRRMGSTLQIVALTAHAMPTERDKCLSVGCDDYLSKPINRKALIETCASLASQAHTVDSESTAA